MNNQVLQGPGSDRATISGGIITQFVRAEAGTDILLWTDGLINGGIDMGTENDHATFRNLTPTHLAPGVLIDGGLGSDRLTWDNTSGRGRRALRELGAVRADRQVATDLLEYADPRRQPAREPDPDHRPTSTVFAGNGDHRIVPSTGGQLHRQQRGNHRPEERSGKQRTR